MGPVVEARDTQGEKVRGPRTLQTLEVDREGLRIRKSASKMGGNPEYILLELSCFLEGPTGVGNSISWSSAF